MPTLKDGTRASTKLTRDAGTFRRSRDGTFDESRTRVGILSEMAAAIPAVAPPDEIIGIAVERLSRAFPSYRVTYGTVAGNDVLRIIHSAPPAAAREDDPGERFAVAPHYLHQLRRGDPIIVHDVFLDSREVTLADALNASETRSFIGVPFRHSAADVAFFAFSWGEPRVWSEHEIETLTSIAQFTDAAVNRANEPKELGQSEQPSRQLQTNGDPAEPVGELKSLIATIRRNAQMALMNTPGDSSAKPHVEAIECAAATAATLSERIGSQRGTGRSYADHTDLPGRVPDILTRDRSWVSTGTVLVVDDEPAIRSLLRAALERHGFEVLTASNGAVGVATFEEHRDSIRAVLVDMTMPGMDGAETFAEIHRSSHDTPVILMSGFAERETTDRFEDLGATAFLRKPFQPSVLLDTLRQALEPVRR